VICELKLWKWDVQAKAHGLVGMRVRRV